MPAVTPNFLFDLESRMQVVLENEYARLSKNLWWKRIATPRQSGSKRELIHFLLSTATIVRTDTGQVNYDDIGSVYTEVVNEFASTGLRLKEEQFDDLDGNGINLASKWSSDVGALTAYWPQQEVTRFLKAAHTSEFVGYDKKNFFAVDHPVNPLDTSKGTFANLMTGAASGDYPGALPIHDTGSGAVAADVALQNLTKLQAYVAGWKMPNGEQPRMLRLAGLLLPPKMMSRGVQITNAKFIGQAASGGAASADVEAIVKNLGIATPIQADELSGFEDDQTYFAIAEQIQSTEVGGIIYQERKPFTIDWYTGREGGNVELARSGEYEWICKARNAVAPGHPYLLIKCKGS